MGLIGYTMALESLINRYTVLILAKTLFIIIAIFLIWFLPCLEKIMKKRHNERKTKRKVKLEKEVKRNTLIFQIAVSFLLIVVGVFFVKGDVNILNALRTDASQDSVGIYEGDARLLGSVYYKNANVFYDLIVDSRSVVFKDNDEIYNIDMSKMNEGFLEDSGDFHGKITYGVNSKFILKIE